MQLEITKMELPDLEQISNTLKQDFDDFWTVNTLKQEIENKSRTKFILHSGKTK